MTEVSKNTVLPNVTTDVTTPFAVAPKDLGDGPSNTATPTTAPDANTTTTKPITTGRGVSHTSEQDPPPPPHPPPSEPSNTDSVRSPKRRKRQHRRTASNPELEDDDDAGVYFSTDMANMAAAAVKSQLFKDIIDFYHSWCRQAKHQLQPGKRHVNEEMERTCCWCGERAYCVCPFCKTACYCGRACQVKDFPQHTVSCPGSSAVPLHTTDLVDATPPPPPSEKPKSPASGAKKKVLPPPPPPPPQPQPQPAATVAVATSPEGNDGTGSGSDKDKESFDCKYCGKSFKQSSSLRSHARVHTGEKPFSCSQCGKTFSASFALRRHERIHTGEKSFNCDQCQKSFSRKDALKQHERVHINAVNRSSAKAAQGKESKKKVSDKDQKQA